MHSTNTGTDRVETMQGWMFPQEAPENDTLTFYSQWTEILMHLDKIHMVGFCVAASARTVGSDVQCYLPCMHVT